MSEHAQPGLPDPQPSRRAMDPAVAAGPRLGIVATAWRWLEMLTLFVLVPGVFAAWIDPYGIVHPRADALGLGFVYDLPIRPTRLLLPTLVVFSLVITLALVVDRSFPSRRLWNFRAFAKDVPRVLLIFAIGAPVLLGLAWAVDTYTGLMRVRFAEGAPVSAFLYLPRERPFVLLLIAIGYPWLSAYPQEITHRAFFFHRYAPILRSPRVLMGANAAAFAWMHAPFWSWIALAMTLAAGVVFAWTYRRTASALAAGMEHALWGWWAFFVGFGYFVFAGGIGTA